MKPTSKYALVMHATFQSWLLSLLFTVLFVFRAASIMNVLWAIVWFVVLWFLAWPIGFFCAGWYVCFSPFEACIDAIKGVTELLMKGVMFPLEVAKHMVEGKAGW